MHLYIPKMKPVKIKYQPPRRRPKGLRKVKIEVFEHEGYLYLKITHNRGVTIIPPVVREDLKIPLPKTKCFKSLIEAYPEIVPTPYGSYP